MNKALLFLLIVMVSSALGCKSPNAGMTVPTPSPSAAKELARAKLEASRHVSYDASYKKLGYPGGDVPETVGACTDVLIRSLRAAGLDLQKVIHEDMLAHPDLYRAGLKTGKTDTNIDHRRVPNHISYFKHVGDPLTLTMVADAKHADAWLPGDLVYWKLPFSNHDHCGVVSDRIGPSGLPMVIHNLANAVEEDCLSSWRIQAHFRPFPVNRAGVRGWVFGRTTRLSDGRTR